MSGLSLAYLDNQVGKGEILSLSRLSVKGGNS